MNNSVLEGAETDRLCGSSVFPRRFPSENTLHVFWGRGEMAVMGVGDTSAAYCFSLLCLLFPYIYIEQYSEKCSGAVNSGKLILFSVFH